ncbi:MAG: hypothetical protein U0414_27390 [Polyangiaceae bacterium]
MRTPGASLTLVLVCALAGRSATARADGASPPAPPPHPSTLPEDARRAPGEKRPLQEYEGRPRETTTAEDALWVPRVLLFPAYLVSEFVVRRPLGAIDTALETGSTGGRLIDVFTFGPRHNAGLVPTAFYDFGFRPSAGLYLFYDDFLATDNQLRAAFATGGERYFRARVVDRIPLHVVRGEDGEHEVRANLQLELAGLARPDHRFYGLGFGSKSAHGSEFEQRSVGGGVRFRAEPWRWSFLESWVLYRHHDFSDGGCDARPSDCDHPPISWAIERGWYAAPVGFDGYQTIKVGARAVVDTRPDRPAPGSGAGSEIRLELTNDTRGGEWAEGGATVGGFLDLTGTRRVLELTLDVRALEPLSSGTAIPFTELVGAARMDGILEDGVLRGFIAGRLLGESSVVASLGYSWPIWAWVDATLQAQVGNVFAHRLADFAPERLRFSFVGGFRSPNHRDHALNVLLGFGTEPFADGGSPESLRFLIGGTTGF